MINTERTKTNLLRKLIIRGKCQVLPLCHAVQRACLWHSVPTDERAEEPAMVSHTFNPNSGDRCTRR